METMLVMGGTAITQFIAAYFALRLIGLTGKRIPWILLAVGLSLFAVLHCIALLEIYKGQVVSLYNLLEELVELSYSALVLSGVIWIAPLFRNLKGNEEALKESRQHLRHLTSRLLALQEKEKHRLSKELHDDLGQSLLALKMHLSVLARNPGTADRARDADYEEMLVSLNRLIDLVRSMYESLSPHLLEILGLPAAIKQLVRETLPHVQEPVVDVDEAQDLFSPETGIIIYRIVQEGVSNIARYAQASRVSLAIKRQGPRVSFLLEDNGKGFKAEEVPAADQVPGRGLGLAAMEERVRMLGGELQIQSREGEGTRLSFMVPVDAQVSDKTSAGPQESPQVLQQGGILRGEVP